MAKKKAQPKAPANEALSELIYGLKYEQAEAIRNLQQVVDRVQWINNAVFGLKAQLAGVAAVALPKAPPDGGGAPLGVDPDER